MNQPTKKKRPQASKNSGGKGGAASKDRRSGAQPAPTTGPPWILAIAALAVILTLGVVVMMAFGDGDDEPVATSDDDGDGDGDGDGADTTARQTTEFGVVTLTGGAPLPSLENPASDPAVGSAAPALESQSQFGEPAVIGESSTVIAFLAHWCPHCQAELPRIVDAVAANSDVDVTVVLTGSNGDAPNWPPSAWLEREGWTGDVFVDDRQQTAAAAYGLSSYPYLVRIDSDGLVSARSAGELGTDALVQFLTGG